MVRLYTEKELRKILKHWEIGKEPIGTIYRMNGTKIADNMWRIGRAYILKTGDREQLLRNSKVAKALPNMRQQNERWGMEISECFFTDYRDTFGSLAHKLPRQLIHRDPNPGYILFVNGEVSGFIDFDLSEINVRLWDICYCATGILSETDEENVEAWLELLSGIVHGYDTENPLTLEEKQAIYYVLCSIQMICVTWFESRDALTTLVKSNRRMLRQIIRHQAEIQAII